MTTAVAIQTESAVRRTSPQEDRREIVRLSGVAWKEYEKFLKLFESHPGFRLTFDHGELEILSPSHAHDDDSRFLELLVFLLVRSYRFPLRLGGSTTLKKLEDQGIEPDSCFWITNAKRISRKRKFDLRRDPPPDLAIEVDVTSSSLDRMSIYAAFGIPELWRLDADRLTFYALENGEYVEIATSRVFPGIASVDLLRFVELSRECDDQVAVTDEFERWLEARRQ